MSALPLSPLATSHHDWPTLRSVASAFLVALAIAPVATVLHEFGHYGSQFVLGYQDVPFISYDSTTMGTAPDDPSGVIDGLTSAAGPLVSLLLVAMAMAIARTGGPAPLALGIVAMDSLRVTAALVFNGVLAGDSPLAGLSDGFSELAVLPYHLGALWAAVLVSVIDLALPLAAAVVVSRSLRGRGVSAVGARLLLAFAGAITGLALWLGVVGPAVLP